MRLHDTKRPLVHTHRADAKIRMRPRDGKRDIAIHAFDHADETIGRDHRRERLHTRFRAHIQGEREVVIDATPRQHFGDDKAVAESRRQPDQSPECRILISEAPHTQRLTRHAATYIQLALARGDRGMHHRGTAL